MRFLPQHIFFSPRALALTLFLGICALPFLVNGQSLTYRNYQVKDGLSSSEAYQLLQDQRGYIWIATDNGVSRFNGFTFDQYTVQDGLPDNTIFEIREDEHGHIWFLGINNRVVYFDYKYKTFISPSYSPVQETALQVLGIKNDFVVHEDHSYSLSTAVSGIQTYFPDGRLESNVIRGYTRVTGFQRRYGKPIFYLHNSIHQDNYVNILLPNGEQSEVPEYVFKNVNNSFRALLALPDDTYLFTIGKHLIHYDNRGIRSITPFPAPIIGVFWDRTDHLWVGMAQNGVARLRQQGDKWLTTNTYLEEHSIIPSFQDREGNYWFGSLGAGIFMIPNANVSTYTSLNGLSSPQVTKSCALPDQKAIALLVNSTELILIDSMGIQHQLSLYPDKSCPLYDLFYQPENGTLWVITQCRAPQTTEFMGIKIRVLPGLKFISITEKEVLTSDRGLTYQNQRIDPQGRIISLPNWDNFLARTTGGAPTDSSWVLLTTHMGLTINHIKSSSWHPINFIPFLETRLNAISKDQYGGYWLGSALEGILYWNGDTTIHLTTQNGLPSNNVRDLLWTDSVLWVGTKQGLGKVAVDPSTLKVDLHSFDTRDGLVSNEINEIRAIQGHLWIATQEGISIVRPQDLIINEVPPRIQVTQVRLNGKSQVTTGEIRTPNQDHSLQITYVGFAYRNQGNLQYRYRLPPFQSYWQLTQESSVQFTSLPPGRYSFQVEAQNHHGVWSREQAPLTIFVPTPIWRTWWFIGLCCLGVYLGFWLILRRRLQQQSQRANLEKKVVLYRNRALAQQMNPHFIFNSLNSIQRYILQNEKKASYQYLGKFASLMRQTLEQSQVDSISLQEEISTLENYLNLEQLRTKGHIEYSFEVDADVVPGQIFVPPMILQPYVENAIWHGLMPQAGGGRVTIRFQQEGAILICVVQDDGIGLTEAAKQKKPKHHSRGMAVTQERLEAMSMLNRHHMSVTIEEWFLPDDRVGGTRVTITIPLE